jgi:hypothetical protein
LNDLSEIKKVNKSDLKAFLTQDHTSFSVLSVSTKHIESTDRISVTLSKNSARSFYLGKEPKKSTTALSNPTKLPDDCLKDAQNCTYFQFFNSKEKKLHTRFKDKIESNFEGTEAQQPSLFLTLTFNTTHENYSAFTTNWNPQDDCWTPIANKGSWLKDWAQNFDDQAEPLKILIQKIPQEQASNFLLANHYLTKFLRQIRHQWKPSRWKRVIVAELQKPKNNRPATWHFHLLSTPIVPYSHKCTLDKNFTSCWNCRAYISQLWPWGRVESRSPGYKTISNYLAKYLAKSFHLRSLYTQHGFQTHSKAYHFFKNLYEYDQKPALLIGRHKLDAQTGQHLPKNQKVFRHYDYATSQTTYFYRTNEQLVGQAQKPFLDKKHFRLGTKSLSPLKLLKLASKHVKKEIYSFKKPQQQLSQDFQEFLITRLLLLCNKAEFLHTPLEQEHVSKESEQCSQSIYHHFQVKPVLHFTFLPEQASIVRQFIDKLDTYAQEFDMAEKKNFLFYPITHDTKHETITKLGGLCGCEIRARNQYLNNWQMNYCYV